MNNTTKRTLVLVAVGLVTALPTAALAGSVCPEAGQQCQIKDFASQPGGEVTMWLNQLQEAQEYEGDWLVIVTPDELAGIEVPEGMGEVPVRLTADQYQTALDLAEQGTTGAATVAVHSDEWVAETEQRLLGGFDVQFNGQVCPYGCQNLDLPGG